MIRLWWGIKPKNTVYPSPIRLLFLVVVSIFSVEITYMLFLHKGLALSPLGEALLDASTLALLVAPALYFLVYRPFVKHIEELRKAEETLRKSGELFKCIFDYSKVGVNILGSDYKYIMVSKSFCEVVGYSEDELLAHDFKGITHPDDIGPNLILSKKLRAGEIDFFHMEKRYVHKSRGIVWGDLTVSAVRTGDGKLQYAIAIIQDITERKLAEEALKESEVRFRQIFQQTTDYVLVLEPRIDAPPVIVDASDSAFAKHGFTRDELIGKPITFLDSEENKMPGRMLALESGKESRFEVTHRRKDGSTFIADVSAQMISLGGKSLVFTVERDVTEQKQAEMKLHLSEEQFRSAFDDAAVGMVMSSLDARIFRVNRAMCGMLGYSEAEMVRKTIGEISHGDDMGVNAEFQKRLLAGEIDSFQMDKRYIHKDGHTVWGHLNVSLVRDLENQPSHCIAQVQDISTRKQAERELLQAKETAEEATRLKDKFVSLVSHDLKSPLASMIGFLNLVRHDDAEPLNDGAKLIVDRAMESGKQMVGLIDDLLTISRFKTGHLKMDFQFFDAKFLGVKMVTGHMYTAQKKGIEIRNALPENSRIYSDKVLLTEALKNLITNAIKFCANGDTVTISLADDSPSTIRVADTGPGIAPEALKNIFRYEAKTSTPGTAGEIGTGLGLPMIKEIMTLLGGEIMVESAVGKGSRFSLVLPHVRPIVLLVDDDQSFRQLLKSILGKMDIDIIEAENGKEALEIISAQTPHLIISDIEMPVMGGLELLEKLKGDNSDARLIPVIIVSGKYGMEIKDTVFRMGADDFSAKVLEADDFIPRVRRFIG